VWFLMRDRPADVGLAPYGQAGDAPPAAPAKAMPPLTALAVASRTPAFWILAGTFFICGASTNGLIGTHLISACHDVGIPAMRSTQLLAMMGIFDILGTTASGWLTDRYSARHLLFAYYSLRGLSLLFLPATLVEGGLSLGVFAVFYGLDWIATVPPTVKLTTEAFGRENTGVVYGWIGASHQLGASMAAFGAGAIRTGLGDYRLAFQTAGVLCLIAGASFVLIGRRALSGNSLVVDSGKLTVASSVAKLPVKLCSPRATRTRHGQLWNSTGNRQLSTANYCLIDWRSSVAPAAKNPDPISPRIAAPFHSSEPTSRLVAGRSGRYTTSTVCRSVRRDQPSNDSVTRFSNAPSGTMRRYVAV
jgi:hypothetical protein